MPDRCVRMRCLSPDAETTAVIDRYRREAAHNLIIILEVVYSIIRRMDYYIHITTSARVYKRDSSVHSHTFSALETVH